MESLGENRFHAEITWIASKLGRSTDSIFGFFAFTHAVKKVVDSGNGESTDVKSGDIRVQLNFLRHAKNYILNFLGLYSMHQIFITHFVFCSVLHRLVQIVHSKK